jgi:hypothetical protein
VEKRIEQIRSPARASAKIEPLATPTKRQNTPIVDGPQKIKKVCRFSWLSKIVNLMTPYSFCRVALVE